MSNPSRIAVIRTWTERYAHKPIKLAEDGYGRIWVRVPDLRRWIPGLAADGHLLKGYPSRVALADETSALYLESSALVRLTQKSTSVPTLKLLAWLESHLIGPARRRQQLEDSRSRDPLRILRDFGPAKVESACELTEVRMPWQSRLNPKDWLITRGQWSLWATSIVGGFASILAVLLSQKLTDRAWNVENNYLMWTWIGIAMATWAVVWNTAWMFGAIKSASRIGIQDESPWKTALWLTSNIAVAFTAAALTLANSKMLVESWWVMLKEGDPPVRVIATGEDTDGKPQRLLVSGGIGMGSTRALRSALEMYPDIKEIELDSPGGMVVEGYGMTALVSTARVNTVVTHSCASSCTLIFIAGQERILGPTAEVGFHRSYSLVGTFEDGWSQTDHEIARWLRTRAIKEEFIQQALDTPGWSIWIPPHDAMLDAGVATLKDPLR